MATRDLGGAPVALGGWSWILISQTLRQMQLHRLHRERCGREKRLPYVGDRLSQGMTSSGPRSQGLLPLHSSCQQHGPAHRICLVRNPDQKAVADQSLLQHRHGNAWVFCSVGVCQSRSRVRHRCRLEAGMEAAAPAPSQPLLWRNILADSLLLQALPSLLSFPIPFSASCRQLLYGQKIDFQLVSLFFFFFQAQSTRTKKGLHRLDKQIIREC